MNILSGIVLAFGLLAGNAAPIIEEAIRPEIKNVYTDLPKADNWWVVPKGVRKMSIHVDARNTQTVLFWLVPTGTQTWGERELIGYDKDGSDGWSIKWEFGKLHLHHHIEIQALGDEFLSGYTINVTSSEQS